MDDNLRVFYSWKFLEQLQLKIYQSGTSDESITGLVILRPMPWGNVWIVLNMQTGFEREKED